MKKEYAKLNLFKYNAIICIREISASLPTHSTSVRMLATLLR